VACGITQALSAPPKWFIASRTAGLHFCGEELEVIDVTCVRCKILYQADEQHIGRMLRCRECGDPVPIADPRSPFRVSRSALKPIQEIASEIPTATRQTRGRRSVRVGAVVFAGAFAVAAVWTWIIDARTPHRKVSQAIDLSDGLVPRDARATAFSLTNRGLLALLSITE
jgi:hypothetical protein